MPTSCTWKVPFKGRFGAYSGAGRQRIVEPFSTQSLQRGTTVCPPPSCHATRPRDSGARTSFRRAYLRGDFPLVLSHTARGCKLSWKVPIETLDFHYYLPLLFDGLRELEHPYVFLSANGIEDLLAKGGGAKRILPVVPQLIMPIKLALNTRNGSIMCRTLKALQQLVRSGEYIGQALIPYYRQLLPVFNMFKNKNINSGDGIDYHQRFHENVGDLIQETLEILERRGGPDAFINIKYMIPTYESCILKKL